MAKSDRLLGRGDVAAVLGDEQAIREGRAQVCAGDVDAIGFGYAVNARRCVGDGAKLPEIFVVAFPPIHREIGGGRKRSGSRSKHTRRPGAAGDSRCRSRWLVDRATAMQPVRIQLAKTPVMVFEAAHERFGKLPFAALFGPAIYRWFTPTTEVSLCGHATLATAYVLFEEMNVSENTLEFDTQSGVLTVWRDKHAYTMKFPARKIVPVDLMDQVEQCIGAEVLATHSAGPTVIAEVADESTVENLEPDIDQIEKTLDYNGLIVTATGERVDFVSRFFGLRVGMPEDPVTGSAHCGLAPYWAERLQIRESSARQLSKRGGELKLRLEEEDVYIGGRCVLYSRGDIMLLCD